MRSVLFLAAVLAGCAAAESTPELPALTVEAAPATTEPAEEAAPAAQEPPCEVVFTPVSPYPAFAAEVDYHASRWAKATGCNVRTGDGGIPVLTVEANDPHLWSAERGKYMGGATEITDAGTTVYIPKSHRPEAVPHELGHAIGRRLDHSPDPSALMATDPGDVECLSAADLTYVCERLACSVFQPECAAEAEQAPAPTPSEAVQGPSPCARVFTPTEAARALTEAATAKWAAATGCPITVGPGGIPVDLVPSILRNGDEKCGVTGHATDSGAVAYILIEQATDHCVNPAQTLLHEMGHGLAPTAANDGHATTGLMRAQQDPNATEVDAPALEVVCSELPCQSFNPKGHES